MNRACAGRRRGHVQVVLFTAGLWMSMAKLQYDGGSSRAAMAEECSNQKCGDVDVGYPFVLRGSSCPSFNASAFALDCGSDGVLRLNLTTALEMNATKALQVLRITEDSVIINITEERTAGPKCGSVNVTDAVNSTETSKVLTLPDSGPYLIAEDNKLVSFGCSITVLLVTDSQRETSPVEVGGCATSCALDPNITEPPNPNCSNRLCCIASIPTAFPIRTLVYTHYNIDLSNSSASACPLSFSIPYSPADFPDFSSDIYALKLSWALPDTRLPRTNDASSFPLDNSFYNACSSNASHIIVKSLPGYRCSCLPGFQGDGYAYGKGCHDIPECSGEHDCVGQSTCSETDGGYDCNCNALWHVGDGKKGGSGCTLSQTVRKVINSIAGVAVFATLLLAIICAKDALHNRKKRKYFVQNGGAQLQEYLSTCGTGRDTTRFFNATELNEATHNFSDQLKLGAGGFGTVYRGTLKSGRVVAVKKANRGDTDNQQFLNELVILTQINHRHIVRLLGCCLETSTPLLVYEFVSNGDLSKNLASETPMNWTKRLQIAIQTAEALAYLHAAASPPILHRDVKSANILLDDNLDAKVADFGVSRLIPDGEEHVSTAVQGTIGYLDPEYFQTLQLTDRSDVYSLGVMLVELVTGLKPVDNCYRETRFANLAVLFIDTLKEKRIEELIDTRADDPNMAPAASWRQRVSILAVAKLARRCLCLRGAGRPSMSQVVHELHRIATAVHSSGREEYDDEGEPWREEYDDEGEPLLLGLKAEPGDEEEAGAVVASHQNSFGDFPEWSVSSTTRELMSPMSAHPR